MQTVIALASFCMLCYIVIQDKTPNAYVVAPFTLIVVSYFVADTQISRIVAKGQAGGYQPTTSIESENTNVSTETTVVNPPNLNS